MLRIITGRSGSGKTREMLGFMKKSENALYIVPEQYSFAAEKKVTEFFGMSGMGFPSVYSFRRLAYYMEELYGGYKGQNLAGTGKVMILGDIVRKLSDKLTLFKGAAKRGEMANEAAVIITTFKQYSITKEKLERAINNTKNSLLGKKLSDCMLISEAYDEFLKEGYRDSDDLLEGLINNIVRGDYFKDKDIFIDAFQAFTPLEYKVIGAMLEKSKSVTVGLCAPEGGDEFVTARRTLDNLVKLSKERGAAFGGIIELEGAMYAAEDEMKALEESFFNENTVFEKDTDKIRIHRARDEYGEVLKAAMEIERLCRDEGYRYRDIVIVARDMEAYEKNLSRVFEIFDIPLFMDKKTPLSGESAAIFMLSAIKTISKGWKNRDVFSYIKTAFSPIDAISASEVENYALACGVRSSDWKRDTKWDMSESIKEKAQDEEYLKRINSAREKVVKPLINLENKIKGKHTGKELSVALYEFMEECNLEEKINKIAYSLQEQCDGEEALRMKQVYDLMIGILECFCDAFGDKMLTADEFLNILASGIESVEIGVIPSTTDSVCVGSIDRARGHGAKAVIIVGAAEGVFPAVPKDTGIFTNADRQELLQYGIELPPDTLGKAYMEESLVYSALSCATERLFVSYPVGKDGSNPSTIIKRIRRVFPHAIKTDEFKVGDVLDDISHAKSTYENFVVAYAEARKSGEIKNEWRTALEFYKNDPLWAEKFKAVEKYTSYKNRTEFIKNELIQLRYGEDISTSVSRLEKYSNCPFSYFADVTLGLKERVEQKVTAQDSGTFLHEFVDAFGKGLVEDSKTWRDIDKDYIDKKTEEIAMELIGGLNKHLLENSPRARALFIRLKKIAKRSVMTLSEHMKKGEFEPLGYEIEFGKKGTFKPLTIELPNGRKAVLRGKIDRIDILETHRGKFVRIIDYKSGSKSFSMSNVYNGLDLQLAVYLTAVCEGEGYHPAGMLYFKIADPVIDRSNAATDENLEKEIMKKLKMDGLVLADDEILSAMDKSYESGSDVIPVKKTKAGGFTESSKVATENDFAAISKHVKNTVKKLCNEIVGGRNDISPTKGACSWCNMKSFCGFDTSVAGCSYRKLDDINDKKALLKIICEANKEAVQEES